MSAPSSLPLERRRRVPAKVAIVLAAVLVAAAVALLGYGIGKHRAAQSHTAVGRAYVGDGQAGVRVGSWMYNIPTTGGAVDWYDSSGAHEGGTPPCLRTAGTYARVRIGYSVAHGPDASSWRQVTWVQCVARS